jgi:hypothetical protein
MKPDQSGMNLPGLEMEIGVGAWLLKRPLINRVSKKAFPGEKICKMPDEIGHHFFIVRERAFARHPSRLQGTQPVGRWRTSAAFEDSRGFAD